MPTLTFRGGAVALYASSSVVLRFFSPPRVVVATTRLEHPDGAPSSRRTDRIHKTDRTHKETGPARRGLRRYHAGSGASVLLFHRNITRDGHYVEPAFTKTAVKPFTSTPPSTGISAAREKCTHNRSTSKTASIIRHILRRH